MLRKVGLVSALLLAIPAFANAWTVTAKIGSGQGTVVSGVKTIAKPGTYVGYFKAANEPLVEDQTFTVDPADGFSLSSVIVNGANVTATGVAAAGDAVDFTVASGSPIKNSQSLVVYFKQNLYGVSVSQSAGGKVTVQRCNAAGTETYGSLSLSTLSNLRPGSYVKVTAMPNADFKVSSIDGSAVTGLRGEIKSSVIQLGAASESVDALFTQVATVTPAISVYPAIANPGATVTVDASKTLSNVSGVTYDFTTNAPGVTFAQSGAVATTSFPTEGTYTITVTANATAGGTTTSVSASWPVEVKINNACLTCHNNRNPQVITAWKAGAHGTTASSCESCHKDTHGTVRTDITLGVGAPSIGAGNYVGSGVCASCHADKYETFKLSGHNFKINKVVNNEMPTFPFSNISGALENMPATTTLNTLGKPTSYEQVSYVVGGYAWKARWIDRAGYIVSSTTQGVQYNLAYPATQAQGWSTYGAVQKKYTCGECHTTGWKYYAGTDAAQKQDGLSGMPGTWAQAGVQCEACHGPGKEHALTPATTNITKVATGRTQAQMQVETGYGNPVNCGECHTRDGERNPYGGEGAATDGTFRSAYNVASGTNDIIGGRIRASSLNNPIGGHHQTGDEMFGVDPDNLAAGPMGKHRKAGMTCGTCHDPHRTTFYQNRLGNGAGVDVACTSCHEVTFTATGAAHSNADCITCHMPKLAKSAVNTGPNAAGKTLGDIKTHVFKIDLDATTNVAAANGGKFLKPFITKDYACGACHSVPADKVANLNTTHGGRIHGKITYKHEGKAIASNITPPTTGDTCGTCHGEKPAAPQYVGADNCKSCHSNTHAQWEKSFHTLKATYGPGFEGQSAGNANIHPWVLANWNNTAAKLLPHAILGQINSNELYVSKERYAISDVAIVVGQVRKQRYAVYDSGAARAEAWVAYTNNGGINWNIKTVDGTPYKTDGTGGTPVVVSYPESKARAGYKFLMIEVDLTKSTPVAKASNYGEHRSWQERCISCHTTGFDKTGWDAAKAKYVAGDATQPDLKNIFVSDIRISCEACHGPGEGHKMVNPTAIADNETRKMVCNQCHTRTQKNLIDTNSHDNRGYVLGQTPFTQVMQYTRPAWGSGNRQVSIDGKGRRDHQQDMDIRMTEYIHTELQGKPASYHGQQSCFDCHATHTIGSSVELQPTATGGRNHLTVASDPTGMFRLKDTREALCGSCHTGDGTSTLPGSINVATALARFNGASGWPTYGWATSPQNGPFAAANWANEGGRGSKNQHLFSSQQYLDAGVTKTRMIGLEPSQYIWSVLTTKLGSATASDYTAIWPWERTLPEYTTNRTIVYGPLSGPPQPAPQ